MSSSLALKNECSSKLKTELIDGKIIMMSPRPRIQHATVCTNITSEFRQYLKGKTCRAFGDGVDVFLDEKNRFIPDTMIVCSKDIIKDDGIHGAPDLVAEVLSPSTMMNDRWKKRYAYAEAGVKEYWLIDPLNCTVEIYYNKNNKLVIDRIYTLDDTEDKIKVSVCENLIIRMKDIFDYI